MEKKIRMILMVGFCLLAFPLGSIAESLSVPTVTLNQLIEESVTYDGQMVAVEGEALVEGLERGDFTWVNINDGTNAMGVYMPRAEAERIKRYGDYHNNGDRIEIEAIFNRSCKQHGGDMELHLVKIRGIKPGSERVTKISDLSMIAALGLTLVTLSLGIYYTRKNGRLGKFKKSVIQKTKL